MSLAARVLGVGLVGPGLAGWREARAILSGCVPYAAAPTVIPSPEALPATERRRAGKGVRLALAAGLAAVADAKCDVRDLVAVFASSTGDGEILHSICEALASNDRLISPTRFHNSVHNAPAGYWGIATGAMTPADSLAAFDASFGAGLLEALGRLAATPAQPVLLVAYDSPYPEPLNATRPIADSFAVGLVLASATFPSIPGKDLEIAIEAAKQLPTSMASEPLERVRLGIPAARSLPLLQLLVQERPGSVQIEYLDGLALRVDVRP